MKHLYTTHNVANELKLSRNTTSLLSWPLRLVQGTPLHTHSSLLPAMLARAFFLLHLLTVCMVSVVANYTETGVFPPDFDFDGYNTPSESSDDEGRPRDFADDRLGLTRANDPDLVAYLQCIKEKTGRAVGTTYYISHRTLCFYQDGDGGDDTEDQYEAGRECDRQLSNGLFATMYFSWTSGGAPVDLRRIEDMVEDDREIVSNIVGPLEPPPPSNSTDPEEIRSRFPYEEVMRVMQPTAR
jgi:hypothetical protein